ncbi:MAG: DUF3422 domain-containing protein [Pseudomonadota bacterium]
MRRTKDHPQRLRLNNEVHARPPGEINGSKQITYLAWMTEGDQVDFEWQRLTKLLEHFGVDIGEPSNHVSVNLGPCHMRWERHTEFTRFTLIDNEPLGEPFAKSVLRHIPQTWLDECQNRVIVATEVAQLIEHEPSRSFGEIADRFFDGNVLVGSQIAEGAAIALTDFAVRSDGYSRLLLINDAMPPQQAGRMLQRLLEIDTYRIMTLLALPVAQSLNPFLNGIEEELVELSEALSDSDELDEQHLLDVLTKMEAVSENRQLATGYRFSAARAYNDLVDRRIDELREVRIPGKQTYREFTQRRLSPAVKTCDAIANRQHSLALRMSRITKLLSTRVDIARQQQNQHLLESMDRRGRVALRLQQMVEGLSIAAISYYVVGLVQYLAKGLEAAGFGVNPTVIVAASVPFIVVIVAVATYTVRKRIERDTNPT